MKVGFNVPLIRIVEWLFLIMSPAVIDGSRHLYERIAALPLIAFCREIILVKPLSLPFHCSRKDAIEPI